MKAKKNEPLIIPLTLSLLISPLLADVAFVGVEGGAPPNFQAQRWSLASEPKSLAVAGNIFGSSGYYLLAPGAEMASKPVVSSDINLTDCNTAIRRPDFVAMHPVAVAGGTWVAMPASINQHRAPTSVAPASSASTPPSMCMPSPRQTPSPCRPVP